MFLGQAKPLILAQSPKYTLHSFLEGLLWMARLHLCFSLHVRIWWGNHSFAGEEMAGLKLSFQHPVHCLGVACEGILGVRIGVLQFVSLFHP